MTCRKNNRGCCPQQRNGSNDRRPRFIFCDSTGDPYLQDDLITDCKRILKAAGLPMTFTPYSARHTMASLLIEGGTNVKAVSERLGHASVTTTLEAYTHVSSGMQSQVSEEIERLLSGKK